MTTELDDFLKQLPVLLRLLADPITPHTNSELWCRIKSFGWDECVPILMAELESGTGDVQRLILGIICEESDQMGNELVQPFFAAVVSLLNSEDRLVRVAAIHAVERLLIFDEHVVASLRHIIANDEPILASQALATLLELDLEHSVIQEIAVMFRSH